MIDPDAVARLEAALRDARGRNGDVAVVYAPDLASLLEDWRRQRAELQHAVEHVEHEALARMQAIEDRKRLREALGRYAMHEGHCNHYLKVALCTCGLARALEGGRG